jgi:hypothetical protein
MFEQFFSFGVGQLFGGARRGQPLVAALGAAVTIWGLLRKLGGKDKPVYTRRLRDGERIQIRMQRGETVVEPADLM